MRCFSLSAEHCAPRFGRIAALTWRHLYQLACQRLPSHEARRIVERASGHDGAEWLTGETCDIQKPLRGNGCPDCAQHGIRPDLRRAVTGLDGRSYLVRC